MFIALFEDGDIPGERMFSFQQNRRPTSTSKKQITKNGENFHNKDDRKMFKISPQGRLFYCRIYNIKFIVHICYILINL